MSIKSQTDVFYGVRVAKHIPAGERTLVAEWISGEKLWWELYEKFEDEEIVYPGVRRWLSGAHDEKNVYLVIDQDGYASKSLEPGQYREIPMTGPDNGQFGWLNLLYRAAEELDLVIERGPFWFVVADEY
jgi:hypothetical protein